MQSTVPPSSTQGSMPTPTSMVGIPGSLTTESTVAPTPTQDLLVEQRTLSTTPTSLPQDMVRGTFSINVSFIYVKTKGGKTENELYVQQYMKRKNTIPAICEILLYFNCNIHTLYFF